MREQVRACLTVGVGLLTADFTRPKIIYRRQQSGSRIRFVSVALHFTEPLHTMRIDTSQLSLYVSVSSLYNRASKSKNYKALHCSDDTQVAFGL